MSEFISEIRAPKPGLPPIECPVGYVAEMRPSSRRRAVVDPPPNCLQVPDDTHMKSLNYPEPKGDFDTDVNELLKTKLFSKDKISEVLHSSVVTLINTLLKGYGVKGIQGCINVSLAQNSQRISVNLAEDYNHVNRDDGFSESLPLKFKTVSSLTQSQPLDGELRNGIENTLVNENCSRTDLLEPLVTGNFENLSSRFPVIGSEFGNDMETVLKQSNRRMSDGSVKSDNDEESGYSSSERESIGSPERKASVESLVPLGSNAEGRELEEHPMMAEFVEPLPHTMTYDVVRPSHVDKSRETSKLETGNAIEYDEYIDFDQKNRWNEQRQSDIESARENEGVMANAEVVKDIPMDLSGDCQVTVETEATKKEVAEASDKTEAKLSCKKCPGSLFNSAGFEAHMLVIHNLHSCSTCSKDFSSKNNLKRHVRIHTGSRPYKCGQCEMSFARKDDLKGHTLKHDFNKPFRCSICKKGYTDRACVKNHMSKEHCSRLMRICPQCGESFDREEAFLEHKQTHPSLKQFACETCPFIGTNHLMAMKHTLLHSHKLFSCKPCNAYFADPFDYTKHVRKHKKNKAYSFYVCCFCNCTLPTYEQFVRHEYSHAQGKLHECSVCKKQFKSKASMLEHALVHTGSNAHSESQNAKSDTSIQPAKAMKAISADTPLHLIEENTFDCPSPPPPKVTVQTTESGESQDDQVCHSTMENRSSESTPVQTTVPNNDEFEGQLLDLSMKSSKSNDNVSSKEKSMVNHQTEQKQLPGFSGFSTSSMSNYSPRNGFVMGTRNVELETPSGGVSLVNGQTSSCSENEKFQIVWRSPPYPYVEDKMKQMSELENLQNINTEKQALLLSRQKSPKLHADGQNIVGTDQSSRFKPYSKMVDLASKFIAARGNFLGQNLLKDIGNTPSGLLLKPASALGQSGGTSLTKALLQMGAKSNEADMADKVKEEHKETPVTDTSTIVIGITGKLCLSPNGMANSHLKQDIGKHHLHQRLSPVRSSTPTVTSMNLSSVNGIQQVPEGSSDKGVSSRDHSRGDACRTHECGICNTTFESFSQLESHSVVNHSRFLCEFCGKAFTARPNRDRHVRYHTGERPYKCELCPSTFFRGDDLKYHRTTRHPMEQISCNRCTASFTWQKDLERHLRHSKCIATA